MSSFYTNVKQYRNKILVCGYENGKRFKREVKYRPYLFLPSDKESPYKTINGQGVVKQHFDSMSDAREFIKSYEDVDNFHIYGMTNFPYVYIFDNFRNVKYDPSLIKTCILDIEVSTEGGNPDIDAANKPVTAITAQYKDITFTFGYGDYRSSNNKVKYIKCKDEEDLLEKFVKLWSSDNYRPDVVTGWNIEFFDIPYLVRRISKLFSEDVAKKLSPWEHLEEKTVIFMGREQQVFIPTGLNILDYLHLYQKFTYSQQESYKLDHIANIELGEKKVDYSEYGNLDDLYNKNYQLFIDYNIHDCELIKRLDDKMKLLDLVYAFAYDAGINFADTLTSVRTWDVIIHNHLLTYKKVVPHVRRQESTGAPVGGFVKSPKIGMHEWVVSFDLTSLYPHLIMGYNISPDTFRGKLKRFGTMDQDMVNQEIDRLLSSESEFADHLKQNNVSMTPNSCTYTNEFQGFLGALMEDAFLKRKEYKKSMLDLMKQNDDKNKDEISKYHNLQMAKKIQLNSCYGALANQYFRWYDIKYAESITTAGQLTIRWAEKYINKFMNEKLKTNGVDYVIAVDTDSLYLDMSGIAKASGFTDKTEIHNYLQKISEETINPFFERVYDKLAKRMNCYKQAMDMKLEIISDRSIFVAKKRYIANVLSSEGVVYEKPKLKVMGIEAVRSSTPQVCRDAIKEALKIIMTKTEDDLRDYVNEFKERFKTLSFEEVAFPRGINGLEKYKDSATIFKKGTPIHVRGALVYNNMLIKKGLHIKEPMVFDRDKIKFCYLVTPNPSHSNVISAPVTPSKELNLDKYIDYNLQFEKSFVEPIKTIIESVGWELEKRATLRRFFE